VVRHQQGAALRRDVLDPLLLDAEPVAVVEVEERLGEREDALGTAPVVYLPRRVLGRDQLAEPARVVRGFGLGTRLR
jgi:hypothetical protein